MISELESYEKMMKGRSLIKMIPGTGKGPVYPECVGVRSDI